MKTNENDGSKANCDNESHSLDYECKCSEMISLFEKDIIKGNPLQLVCKIKNLNPSLSLSSPHDMYDISLCINPSLAVSDNLVRGNQTIDKMSSKLRKSPINSSLNPNAASFIPRPREKGQVSVQGNEKDLIEIASLSDSSEHEIMGVVPSFVGTETAENLLNASPPLHDISTPKMSLGNDSFNEDVYSHEDDINIQEEPFLSDFSDNRLSNVSFQNISSADEIEDPKVILRTLKENNADRPVIAHLNINSIFPKFEPLIDMIESSIDFLLVTETKLDDTFLRGQFHIDGFAKPVRLDRTRNGGGLMVFMRNDLPCDELKSHEFPDGTECTFLEMRIRQSKWLIVVGYNPHKDNIQGFLENVSRELDKYLPKYENLLMLGDWNSAVKEEHMSNFCDMYGLNNLINEPTCFKSTENPSSIDIMLTNKKLSFQNSTTVETGLSDFHKMTVTVMKRFFKKKEPVTIEYRDMKKFDGMKFREDIRNKLERKGDVNIDDFKNIFQTVWDSHAPVKKKVVRGNNAPFMNRTLSKAFMHRANLKNKYLKSPNEHSKIAYKQYRNFCVSLLRKEKKKFYNNMDLSVMKDNKKFWKNVKPLFTGKSKTMTKIMLIERDEMITNQDKVSEIMNNYFIDAVQNLDIDKFCCVDSEEIQSGNIDAQIDSILKNYKLHPSIVMIKNKVKIEEKFSFIDTDQDRMYEAIKSLNTK